MALTVLASKTELLAQEVGTNDFRISFTGPDGETATDAFEPRAAFNWRENQYLVVWRADTVDVSVADEEYEIFGRILNADGSAASSTVRISTLGTAGSPSFDAFAAHPAYNAVDNEYMVVFCGDDDRLLDGAQLVDGEREVFGQRIDKDGNLVGATAFRVSDMGPNSNPAYDVICGGGVSLGITHNSTDNEYLVVWSGDDSTAATVNGEREIFGQLLEADGTETGPNDFRISSLGPSMNSSYDSEEPSVAWDSLNNQYLVVWEGEDSTATLVNGHKEIYGQLVSNTGSLTGPTNFRISEMGPDGDEIFDADAPAVAFNPLNEEFLVVWEGKDIRSGIVDDDNVEIFGQRITTAGAEVGTNDILISRMGPQGDPDFQAAEPRVAYNPIDNSYFVVWSGADDALDLAFGEFEIYGQAIHGDRSRGDEYGADDVRLSDIGPDLVGEYDAAEPDVVINLIDNEFLVVFDAEDSTTTLVEDEYEVFGQRYASPPPPGAAVSAFAFLEGAYSTGTGLMKTDLAQSSLVPLAQPYDAAVFNSTALNFDSAQVAFAIPDSAVDWVLVSLRTGTGAGSEVSGSEQAALVYASGRIASVGHDSLHFAGVADGSYYLVVDHRNHLSVMSSAALTISGGAGSWNFTTAASQSFDSGATELETGVYGLFSADGNPDAEADIGDFAVWLPEAKSAATGYLMSDYNLDGEAAIDDFALWLVNAKAAVESKVP